MEESDKLFFNSLLLRERESFEDTLKKMKEHGVANGDNFNSGELSSYDNHPADLGTEVYQEGMNSNLKTHELYQLSQVDMALEKLEKGTFGVCEFCGKEIFKERLEVKPYARLCIECENSRDTNMNYLRNERPVEEKVVDAPFGRKYLNKQEDDEYEGLDYLNDLMKYGSSSTPQDMGGYKDYKEFFTNEVDNQGVVDKMDNISNEQYKNQLPD
jgi:YteA family regulatory protein